MPETSNDSSSRDLRGRQTTATGSPATGSMPSSLYILCSGLVCAFAYFAYIYARDGTIFPERAPKDLPPQAVVRHPPVLSLPLLISR
jgi:hypothetical protein